MRRFVAQRVAEVAQRRAIFDAAVAMPTPLAEPHSSNLTMNCFHLGEKDFYFRSLPPTQQGYAALYRFSAGERHTKKAKPVRRIVRPPTPQLFSCFDSRATHARTHLPATLASVPFGFVLARVRVRVRV
jgi:hypothetical protein